MDPGLADALAAPAGTVAVDACWQQLFAHAEKLTAAPAQCGAADIAALRAAGLSDEQITDGVQVAAYFNYINRIAEGLGVDLEPDMRADGPLAGGRGDG